MKLTDLHGASQSRRSRLTHENDFELGRLGSDYDLSENPSPWLLYGELCQRLAQHPSLPCTKDCTIPHQKAEHFDSELSWIILCLVPGATQQELLQSRFREGHAEGMEISVLLIQQTFASLDRALTASWPSLDRLIGRTLVLRTNGPLE